MSRLPGLLGQIAEVAGESAATRIALQAGGTEMKFSKRKGSLLVRMVGADAAARIVEAFGAENYTIPMAHYRGQKGRRAQAARMLREGATQNAAAQACDVHVRTVRRVKRALSEAEGLPLFPDD